MIIRKIIKYEVLPVSLSFSFLLVYAVCTSDTSFAFTKRHGRVSFFHFHDCCAHSFVLPVRNMAMVSLLLLTCFFQLECFVMELISIQ